MTDRVLLPIRGADPRRRPPPDAGLDAVTPVVEDGALLVFSGVESLRRWRDRARFVSARVAELADVARRAGAVVIVRDVAGPVRTRIPCDAAGATPAPFGLRGLAAPLAPAAVDRLRDVLRARPPVRAAWVVEATVDGAPVIAVAFLVEAEHDDAPALVRATAEDVLPLLPVDRYEGVQLVVLDDGEVGRAIRAADEPVYSRS